MAAKRARVSSALAFGNIAKDQDDTEERAAGARIGAPLSSMGRSTPSLAMSSG